MKACEVNLQIARWPDHQITRLLSSASRSSLLLSGIVAAAGADGQLFVLSGASVNVNRSKAADIFGRRGCVSNGVLVSDIVGNASADVIHFGQAGREIRNAAAAVSKNLERPSCLTCLLLPEQPNCVNRRAVFLLQMMHRLLHALLAGVVFAVGHNENDFSLQR